MKQLVLDLPTFGFVVTTRAALGFGLGLLISARLPPERRRAIGAGLVVLGALTTIPAARSVFRSIRRSGPSGHEGIGRDARLVGARRFPRKGDDDR
jgi:hypothetical protein